MKKTIIVIIISLMIVIIVSGCTKKQKSVDTPIRYLDIEHIKLDNLYQYEKKDVYFYREECSYCKKIKNDILNYAKNNNIVFFVDIPSNREILSEMYNTEFLGVPAILVFEDNIIIDSYYGYSMVLEYINQDERG